MYLIDGEGVKNRIASFDREHGGEANSLCADGWIFYADGAQREVNPQGLLLDPPNDPLERARKKRHYAKLALAHAVREFDGKRRSLLQSVNSNLNGEHPSFPDHNTHDQIRELERLRDAVKSAQAKVAAADEACEKIDPVRQRAAHMAAMDARARQENLQLKDRLLSIEV